MSNKKADTSSGELIKRKEKRYEKPIIMKFFNCNRGLFQEYKWIDSNVKVLIYTSKRPNDRTIPLLYTLCLSSRQIVEATEPSCDNGIEFTAVNKGEREDTAS